MDISEGISPASYHISTEDAAYPEGDDPSLMGYAASSVEMRRLPGICLH